MVSILMILCNYRIMKIIIDLALTRQRKNWPLSLIILFQCINPGWFVSIGNIASCQRCYGDYYLPTYLQKFPSICTNLNKVQPHRQMLYIHPIARIH